jgi:hypothetical protein
MPKPTKDALLIVDLLDSARWAGKPISAVLIDRLHSNRTLLRQRRRDAKEAPFKYNTPKMRTYVRESALRSCARILAENKRLRSLQRRYASLQTIP